MIEIKDLSDRWVFHLIVDDLWSLNGIELSVIPWHRSAGLLFVNAKKCSAANAPAAAKATKIPATKGILNGRGRKSVIDRSDLSTDQAWLSPRQTPRS